MVCNYNDKGCIGFFIPFYQIIAHVIYGNIIFSQNSRLNLNNSFFCKKIFKIYKKYNNLYDSTWALIGHELAATEDLSRALFAEDTLNRYPVLEERVEEYKKMGLSRYSK